MSPLFSLAYARLAITVRNVDITVTRVSICNVNVNNVPFLLNTPFMILHLQIFRIMEGVRVSSYVSINSGKLHVLSRFDYVRVCMNVCLSPSLCFFSSSSIALRGGEVHLLQVRERERHAYGRERIMHTHKERGGEEE